MKKFAFVFTVLLSFLTACKSSGSISDSASKKASQSETWIIADNKVPCSEGVTEMCYQVKKTGEYEYSLVKATIEGFTFEPNHKYQIVVKEKKGNYVLVKELFKVSTKK